MARKARTISLPEGLSERVDDAAETAGLTPSAWLAAAAEEKLRVEEGLAAMAEWWAEAGGPPTAEETADAEASVARALAHHLGLDQHAER